jgi:hypothetical protein
VFYRSFVRPWSYIQISSYDRRFHLKGIAAMVKGCLRAGFWDQRFV